MIKILELFGGIGACSKALERLGIEYEIADYVEIDKYAVASFNAIYGTNFEPQDITTWNKDIEVDLIMHGSPCQDFSLAGLQAGGDEGSGTRSSLMYETLRIVKKLRPKYVIWENVKNVISKKHMHNFNNYINRMSELGYKSFYKVLNAKDYGIPQNRERVFTVSILDGSDYEFPKPMPLKLKLKDMLEDEVEKKFFLSDEIINAITLQDITKINDNFTMCKTLRETLETNDISDGVNMIDGYNRNIRNDELSGSITTRIDASNNTYLAIKNATKKGYDEATNGDSVNLSYPDSKTRRGRVGHGISQTLQCNDSMGVVEKARKDIKEEEKYCEYCGKKLERKRFNGRLEDFIVFKNRKYCNRECMRKDYLKIGDNHNQTYSNAHTTARKINELILHKEECELCGSRTNLDIHHIDGNWQNNNLDNLMCLCRSCHTKYERNKNKTNNELLIRKLTPREVWRLMGFDDEDFEKASKVNSNSQLYKQAGNSIVVNVLEAILKKIIEKSDK